MKALFALVIALPLALALAPAGAASVARAETGPSPEQFVEKTANEVLEVLGDKSLDHDKKISRLEAMLDERSDFETVTKLVLGASYRQFSDSQRSEFLKVFREYLSVTYGKQIDKYADQRIVVTGGRPEARGDYTVQTKLVRKSGGDLIVDYRLRQKDGHWVLLDVIGEGISLIANLRSQFQEILGRGGPDRLLQVLREKNAAGGGDPLPIQPS